MVYLGPLGCTGSGVPTISLCCVPVVAARYTKEPSAEDEGLLMFQAGLSAFWRFWQLATAVAALAVMCAAGQNGVALQSFQAFIWLVTAMAAVIAWAIFNMAHDISMLLPKDLRRWLFLLTEFVSRCTLRCIQYSAGCTVYGIQYTEHSTVYSMGHMCPLYCMLYLFSTPTVLVRIGKQARTQVELSWFPPSGLLEGLGSHMHLSGNLLCLTTQYCIEHSSIMHVCTESLCTGCVCLKPHACPQQRPRDQKENNE